MRRKPWAFAITNRLSRAPRRQRQRFRRVDARARSRRNRCCGRSARRAAGTIRASSPRGIAAAATSGMYRLIDFRRDKDGVPADGRFDPVRSESQRPDRLAALRRRREALHLGPGRTEGRRSAGERTGCAADGGQLPAAEEDSAWALRSTASRCCRARCAACAAVPVPARRWWPARPTGRRSRLPSGEIRRVPAACRATIGKVGNSGSHEHRFGKAGRKRWLGRRPHVRGTAMNPIDHPHGGGEGRTKGGRHPVSPTGKPAKGGATRKKRKPSNKAIVRRRRSRRYGQLKLPGSKRREW